MSDPDVVTLHVNVSLEGGEGHFALSTQDSVIYLVCVARLDREGAIPTTTSYRHGLRLTSTAGEAAFVLHVTDVRDNAPAFDRQLYRPSLCLKLPCLAASWCG